MEEEKMDVDDGNLEDRNIKMEKTGDDHQLTERKKVPKWTTLEHKGPVFAPPYKRLPPYVVFRYDGTVFLLSEDAEEVAGFYARLLKDGKYTDNPKFQRNFFASWRDVMTQNEKDTIKDLSKCDFSDMADYLNKQPVNQKIDIPDGYDSCKVDGLVQKIRNCKVEPPCLLKSRGRNMGRLKKRVKPEDVTINCSKGKTPPPHPPYENSCWQKVVSINTVTWLARWKGLDKWKYIKLAPSTELKSKEELKKYNTARKLHQRIDKIRETYRNDWKNADDEVCQRSVALYFIDRLVFRAGSKQDEQDEDNFTAGCCSLLVEHIKLRKDGNKCMVIFDFLGKGSIKYYNEVQVEKIVYENLVHFMKNKEPTEKLFDKLTATQLNKYLKTTFGMRKLSAKVFRTYHASIIMQRELDKSELKPMAAFERANRTVAVLCNHKMKKKKGPGGQDDVNTKTSRVNYIDPRIIVA